MEVKVLFKAHVNKVKKKLDHTAAASYLVTSFFARQAFMNQTA